MHGRNDRERPTERMCLASLCCWLMTVLLSSASSGEYATVEPSASCRPLIEVGDSGSAVALNNTLIACVTRDRRVFFLTRARNNGGDEARGAATSGVLCSSGQVLALSFKRGDPGHAG